MADGITISVTEDVTSVTVTEDVTTIDITPSVTTVEAKGISIANAGAATAMTYQGTSNTLGTGGNVAASLDHINTNGFNKNANNTVDGNTTIAYDHTLNFTAGTAYDALNLANNNIIGVNKLHFADAGFSEGIDWENIRISETNDALTANAPGDLHIQFKQSDNTYARRFTVRDTGVDVVGNAVISGTATFAGGTTSADLNFGNSDKAIFGDASALQIYHDGSHSYVREVGTGNLKLQGTNLNLQNEGGTKDYLVAVNSGAVTLYYDNSPTLATSANGVSITGRAVASEDFRADIFRGTTFSSTNFLDFDDDETGPGSNAVSLESIAGMNLKFDTNNSDAFAFKIFGNGSSTATFTIDNSLNVGIGKEDPATQLDVDGTITGTTFSGDLNGTINTATTATTQSQSNNSTKVATTAYVDTAVAGKDNTDEITEGSSNLYFTNARADARVSALAVLDSEVDADIKTLSLPASTTISTYGKSLVDDADAATARTTLGLGTAATTASTAYVAASSLSTFGGTLIDDADAATARTTLGLGTAATGNTDDFATGAEGDLAASALQPGSIVNNLTSTSTNAPLSAAQGKALQDKTHARLTFGISDDNAVEIDGNATNGDMAIFTANGITSTNTLTAAQFSIGSDFSVGQVGSDLIFKHGTTSIMKIDSSGNLTVIGNVTAFGPIS